VSGAVAGFDHAFVELAAHAAALESRDAMNLYLQCLIALAPEIIVVATALFVLLADLVLVREKPFAQRVGLTGTLTCLGCALAMAWLVLAPCSTHVAMLAISPVTQWLKLPLLLLTIFAAVLSWHQRFTRHAGEYFAVLLLAAAGLMLLVSSDNLLLIFIALELLSTSLYALAAFDKGSLASSEAALKYFLFGGISAAFTLFGISLIYGIAGDIQLDVIAARLRGHPAEPVLYAALVMTLVGFAFKLAAAPFHLWAPDVYEGAPTPVASFIASGSKVASFFVLARILLSAFPGARGTAALVDHLPGWAPVLMVLAVLSMVAGNVAAIVQTNVKRLLAYSAIAHAGYALLALLADQRHALSSLLFYTITYAFTVLGAFAVVGVVEDSGRKASLADFAGLSRRAPLLSFCMLVFMLSLAGIPPLSGFFGKFYVFTAAAEAAPKLSLLWLVVLGVAASAVSLYYYLQVVKQIYAVAPSPAPAWPRPALSARVAIVLLAAIVIVLGCVPDLLLGKISALLNSNPF
jgi:NADH-quinone oxidoreductase subunit N